MAYRRRKVARNEDLFEQIGKDLYFGLVDHDKVRSFHFHKKRPFRVFKVGDLCTGSNNACGTELKLFLEIELGLVSVHGNENLLEYMIAYVTIGHFSYLNKDLQPIPLPYMKKEDMLLFFKLYDPEKEELRYVGKLSVKDSGRPFGILTKLNEMAGFAPNESIELYKEIKFGSIVLCERIGKWSTFRNNKLENGDIICFQKCPTYESQARYQYFDIPSFLEHVRNGQCRPTKKLRTVEKQLGNDQRVSIKKHKPRCFQSVSVPKKRSQTCMPLVGMSTKKNVTPRPAEVMGAMPSSESGADKGKGRIEDIPPFEYMESSKFTWRIENWSKLETQKIPLKYSCLVDSNSQDDVHGEENTLEDDLHNFSMLLGPHGLIHRPSSV